MKNLGKVLALASLGLLLSGCAQKNPKLTNEFWQKSQEHKIVVAKVKAPKPTLTQSGSIGLLDYAINATVTNSFGDYLKTVKLDWYHDELAHKFTDNLKQHNIAATAHNVAVSLNKKEREAFLMQMEGNKLLVVELEGIGAVRSYYSFVPLGAPKAYCTLSGELIDQANKKVLWRHSVRIEKPVIGEWDQPPSYPNFTKALMSAAHAAKEELMDSFFSGH